MCPLEISFRFPFGRYAATPWFRSRREDVGNVEWPPSPWRLARALVAVAAERGSQSSWADSLELAQRLASSPPRYLLPSTGELHYTQWMPRLDFKDSLTSAERLDNGHTLLDLDPNAWLTARWDTLDLDARALTLLDGLLASLPFLGQSVSVCEARRGPPPSGAEQPGTAAPDEAPEPGAENRIQLLVAESGIEAKQLCADTTDETLKMQPTPPGTRWVTYLVTVPVPRRPDSTQPLTAVVYGLGGSLRPPVPRLDDVSGADDDVTIREAVAIALRKTTGRRHIAADAITLMDDDLDGRAERLRLALDEPLERWKAKRLLDPGADLVVGRGELVCAARSGDREPPRVTINCSLHLDAVEWPDERRDEVPRLHSEPVCLRVRSERPPPLADAITVAEVFRRRLLGVAATMWGAQAIPTRLSGRDQSGARSVADHRHAHFLVGSTNGHDVTHLMIWAPEGFSREERKALAAVSLPALSGAGIRLRPADDHPWLGPASRWLTALPFLPVRHSKRRGGVSSTRSKSRWRWS